MAEWDAEWDIDDMPLAWAQLEYRKICQEMAGRVSPARQRKLQEREQKLVQHVKDCGYDERDLFGVVT